LGSPLLGFGKIKDIHAGTQPLETGGGTRQVEVPGAIRYRHQDAARLQITNHVEVLESDLPDEQGFEVAAATQVPEEGREPA
jgi:hypothetical protein